MRRSHLYYDMSPEAGDFLKIRLTKRFAKIINGVDLSGVRAGDVLDLSPRDAGVLLAEGWAVPIDESDAAAKHESLRAEAADDSRTRR